MKLLKILLPDAAAAMALGMIVLVIMDSFNPLMSFLTSTSTKVYIVIMGAVCVAAAMVTALDRKKNN